MRFCSLKVQNLVLKIGLFARVRYLSNSCAKLHVFFLAEILKLYLRKSGNSEKTRLDQIIRQGLSIVRRLTKNFLSKSAVELYLTVC